MIRSYLKLLIILAINPQVFLLADSIENRLNEHKKVVIKAVAQVLRTKDATDNIFYDSIVQWPSLSPSATSVIKPISWKRTSKTNYRQGVTSNKPVLLSGLIEPILKQNHHHLTKSGRGEMSKRIRRRKPIEIINTQIQEDKIIVTDNKDGWSWAQNDKPHLGTTTARNQFEIIRMNQNVTKVLPVRRMNILDDVERNRPQKWVHCMDFITPRLRGFKDDWKRKLINSSDGDIRRLIHLFTTNTTDHTREEIVAILSEISNIRMRLYQWDHSAVTLMLNVLIRGPVHTFRTLKRGIKILIQKWHLDLSSMGVFLEQSRVIRPPCINITGDIGYTKSPDLSKYAKNKPDKPTRKPRDNLKSCETTERNNKWN